MSQYPLPVPGGSGQTVRNNINSALDALYTGHSGVSAPSSPKTWQIWTDTSVSPPVERQWNGSAWVEKANEQRVAVADAAYTISTSGNRIIGYTSLTAGRTVTLPSAAGMAGQRITIQDESGNASASKPITIQRAGSDLVSGVVSVAIASPYGAVTLISNGGAKWIVQRPKIRQQIFTASGTWTCPAGVDLVRVTVAGGGGGGASPGSGGGGGGGGGMVVTKTISVVPGTAYTITVGSGGAAGAAGGSSSFGALVTATGGGRGSGSFGGVYGGGTAPEIWGICTPYGSGASPGYAGGASAYALGGAYIGSYVGGGGGASYGPGANGGYSGGAGSSAAANTGGGGGGGYLSSGGSGGSGIVIIESVE